MRPHLARPTIALLCAGLIGACERPPPPLAESEIPVLRTVEVEYDESRLRLTGDHVLSEEESEVVLALTRSSTDRYIDARSVAGEHRSGQAFRGSLSLHSGWREELFPLAREAYVATYPLPEGTLHHDPSLSSNLRVVGSAAMMRGYSDWFSGFVTKVIEVSSDGFYTFGVDSDEGTIGTLQSLDHGMHDVQVLWYDWKERGMAGRLNGAEDVFVPAGTYLLTAQYFEAVGDAGYHVAATRQSPPPAPVTEAEIPALRSVDVAYDALRLRASAVGSLSPDQERIALALTRAGMARYLEARAGTGVPEPDGSFHGPLSLHEGWREEFFPLGWDAYEKTFPLPVGTVYHQADGPGVYRDIGSGSMAPGAWDNYTAFVTRVLEVPDDGLYTFGFDSDDGTIGTLLPVGQDMHDVLVLWYDWSPHSMAGQLSEVRDVSVPAGTYLLIFHYFDEEYEAGYHVSGSRQTTG